MSRTDRPPTLAEMISEFADIGATHAHWDYLDGSLHVIVRARRISCHAGSQINSRRLMHARLLGRREMEKGK